MTKPFEPRGTWTALVTPFDSEGRLDEARFKRLVQFQIDEGITGLLPCGTTGESPTLEWGEHGRMVRAAVQLAGDKVGVLAGTGSNSTAEAIEGTRTARDHGAGAALLVDCYYNGPSSLELRTEYYERIAQAVDGIALVPYIIPGRTGCALGAADLAHLHLSAPSRFPAVKEATGDLERMREDRRLAGSSLAIMSGDDDLTVPMMRDSAIGCSGVISVMSNIVPGALSQLVAAVAAGEQAKADRLLAAISPLFKLVVAKAKSQRTLPGGRTVEVEDRFRNPLPVKTMMAGLGMLDGLCRAPLGKMTAPAVAACRAALTQVWRSDPAVLAPIEKAFGVNLEQRLADDRLWATLTV